MKNTDKNFQDEEIWKEIQGYEGIYEVSTKGRVRNLENGRILDGGKNNHDGYRRVTLKGKTYRVNRLVALAFLDNPHNLPQVDHLDENKGNNDVSNLRWVTASENTRHSSHKYSCQVKQIDKNGNLIKIWSSIKQIKRELGYSTHPIVKVCKGKQHYSYGYKWEYLDYNSQRVMNRQVIVYKGSEYIGIFASTAKASEALGLNYYSVSECLRGRKATNKGYTFKYLD